MRGGPGIIICIALIAPCCGRGPADRAAEVRRDAGDAAAAAGDAAAPGEETGVAPAGDFPALETEPVKIYFPSEDGVVLVAEERTVFKTPRPGDRAKQIVAALLEGPQAGGASRAMPEGTQLRQLFVLADGTAWADFSSDLRDNLGGGSAMEIMAVYAVVDSIALNVSEIARVGILVDGRPVETLNGHLDLRRALVARRDLIAGGSGRGE